MSASPDADEFGLDRFVDAQSGGTYEQARSELLAGRKESHWMWFIFPQVAGLGRSEMSIRYALSGTDEASAYWAHPLLGQRYEECCAAILGLGDVSVVRVLGSVDTQKLRSSLTLFAAVATPSITIDKLLARHFDGNRDPATLALL